MGTFTYSDHLREVISTSEEKKGDQHAEIQNDRTHANTLVESGIGISLSSVRTDLCSFLHNISKILLENAPEEQIRQGGLFLGGPLTTRVRHFQTNNVFR